MSLPHCPKCNSEYTYEDNGMYICPELCFTNGNDELQSQESDELIVKDANGNLLADGDSVTIIKDLKVKGSSSMLEIGTKVKNIRLVEGDHNIDCKIDGFGPMKLKSEFVKRTDCIVIGKPDERSRRIRNEMRLPDATLTASYQAYKFTPSVRPDLHPATVSNYT